MVKDEIEEVYITEEDARQTMRQRQIKSKNRHINRNAGIRQE